MDLGKWINDFMVGKKKYSFAVLLPLIVGIIQTFWGARDPQTADLLTRFVDQYGLTILTTVSGVIYATLEAVKDWNVAKVAVATAVVATPTAPGPSGGLPAQITPPADPGASLPAAPAATQAAAQVPQVPLVKDRLAAGEKLVTDPSNNYAGMWGYLEGALGKRVQAFMKQMLDNNPQMGTMEAIQKVVNDFLGLDWDEQTCSLAQSILGLPATLHALHDVDIMGEFKKAYDKGTLGNAMFESLQISAYRGIRKDIIDEVTLRVIDDSSKWADRMLALKEFGVSDESIKRTVAAGGMLWIARTIPGADGFSLVEFNGFDLAGVDPATLKPINR